MFLLLQKELMIMQKEGSGKTKWIEKKSRSI